MLLNYWIGVTFSCYRNTEPLCLGVRKLTRSHITFSTKQMKGSLHSVASCTILLLYKCDACRRHLIWALSWFLLSHPIYPVLNLCVRLRMKLLSCMLKLKVLYTFCILIKPGLAGCRELQVFFTWGQEYFSLLPKQQLLLIPSSHSTRAFSQSWKGP